MNNRELMLKQIDITLKQEKIYLKKFNKQLENPDILEADKKRISIFRQASLATIDRCKKAKLKYRKDIVESNKYVLEKERVQKQQE